MADFSTLNMSVNTGTDASPTWVAFSNGGAAGVNELRFCASGAGAATTPSFRWPAVTRPITGTAVVPECWLFTSDMSGQKVATYDGTSAHYMQFRWNWDNVGSFASAPTFTAYSDTTHTAPSPGTQPGGQSGSPLINGAAPDTGTSTITSYVKCNCFGFGVSNAGSQQTPASNAGGTLSATVGSNGGVASSTINNAWFTNWVSLMGALNYIQDGQVPQATTAGQWYFLLSIFVGAGMTASIMTFTLSFTYSHT